MTSVKALFFLIVAAFFAEDSWKSISKYLCTESPLAYSFRHEYKSKVGCLSGHFFILGICSEVLLEADGAFGVP